MEFRFNAIYHLLMHNDKIWTILLRLWSRSLTPRMHLASDNVRICCVRFGSGVQTDATFTPNNVGTCSACCGKDTTHTCETLETMCNVCDWPQQCWKSNSVVLWQSRMEQKKCWELLAQKFNCFQTLHNNSQQHATTTYNIMQKGAQTDATCIKTCNIQQLMLCPLQLFMVNLQSSWGPFFLGWFDKSFGPFVG